LVDQKKVIKIESEFLVERESLGGEKRRSFS